MEYTGADWEIARYKLFFRNKHYQTMRWLSIDRKNNARGYSVTNIAKACWICNSLKNEFFTPTDMKRISPRLIRELRRALKNN